MDILMNKIMIIYNKKIYNLRYTNDIDCENHLRKNSKLPWFKNTIMVFRKNNI
jgi:hypothetical protein